MDPQTLSAVWLAEDGRNVDAVRRDGRHPDLFAGAHSLNSEVLERKALLPFHQKRYCQQNDDKSAGQPPGAPSSPAREI